MSGNVRTFALRRPGCGSWGGTLCVRLAEQPGDQLRSVLFASCESRPEPLTFGAGGAPGCQRGAREEWGVANGAPPLSRARSRVPASSPYPARLETLPSGTCHVRPARAGSRFRSCRGARGSTLPGLRPTCRDPIRITSGLPTECDVRNAVCPERGVHSLRRRSAVRRYGARPATSRLRSHRADQGGPCDPCHTCPGRCARMPMSSGVRLRGRSSATTGTGTPHDVAAACPTGVERSTRIRARPPYDGSAKSTQPWTRT